MTDYKLLEGKKVLIVDDEPDVLESMDDLLYMCDTKKADNFDDAKSLLESDYFDIAVLDIMGVNGYALLEIAKKLGIIVVMATAHALTVEDTMHSHKMGADYYVPKEKLVNIAEYLKEILEAREKGKSTWWRWLERFGSFYAKKFGEDWKKSDEDFWTGIPY